MYITKNAGLARENPTRGHQRENVRHGINIWCVHLAVLLLQLDKRNKIVSSYYTATARRRINFFTQAKKHKPPDNKTPYYLTRHEAKSATCRTTPQPSQLKADPNTVETRNKASLKNAGAPYCSGKTRLSHLRPTKMRWPLHARTGPLNSAVTILLWTNIPFRKMVWKWQGTFSARPGRRLSLSTRLNQCNRQTWGNFTQG